jgi:hypothetical protein
MKKLLVVGVIGIFLGLAYAPSINANVSRDSELVEITTEICGLGGGKHTVKLTKDETEEVEQLIDDIKRRLDEVETREETVEIFKEAIEELDKYKLLGRMNINQVQKLITGQFQNMWKGEFLEKVNIDSSIKGNFFCLLAGNTDFTIFNGILSTLFLALSFLFLGFEVFILLWMGSYYFSNFFPLSAGHTISLGVQGTQWTYPAEGWVFTTGLTGVKNWEGNLIGDIRLGILDEFIGVTGFTGIKIKNLNSNDVFYMGFALRAKIECW